MKTKLTLILTTALALPVLADDKPKQTDKPPVAPGGGITIKRAPQGTFLGVAMDVVPAAVRAQLNIPAGVGVSVGYVAKNSPAEKAGLKANDVITQLDDQIILNAAQLQGLIQTKKAGDEVTLTYYRKGKEHTAKAKLAKGAMAMPRKPAAGGGQGQAQGFRLENGQWKPFRLPNGLGMLRQFRLNPDNPEQLEGQLEQFREMLEQLQEQLPGQLNINPEQLEEMLRKGGAFPGLRIPKNGQPNGQPLKPLRKEFNFDFNLPNGLKQGAHAQSTVTMADQTGSYTLKTTNGKKHFSAKDENGEELFEGPVDTEEQRDTLPADLFKKLKQLEGGGLNLRGLPRGLNRDGKFNFEFRLPPNKREGEEKPRKNRSDA